MKAQPIKAILFDLDGTLLRVQMSEFIPRYVAGLATCCADLVSPRKFTEAMLGAIRSLIRFAGAGERTNEQRLLGFLQQQLSLAEDLLHERFEGYRHDGLEDLAELVKPIPQARSILQYCLQAELPVALATNPVFPRFVVDARLRWGGLEDLDFAYLTSYENSCFCKPHAGYFLEIADHLGVAPETCLMIGNDNQQDLAAAGARMQTFWVDTWAVQREGAAWPCEHRGDHQLLHDFLRQAF